MTNICINCIHKDVCYKYRLNYVGAREGTCTEFISDEVRCSNCGNFLKPNEGTIIAGRWRTFIICSECKDKIDDFVKWSDEE